MRGPHLTIAVLLAASVTQAPRKLDRATLDASLRAGARYMLASQKPEGNFTYQYDFVAKKEITGSSAVRQAGALWGLALIHRDAPTEETAAAIGKGLAFFLRHSRLTEDGRRYVVYPGSRSGRTGTVALVSLALIELLGAKSGVGDRDARTKRLEEYLAFLWSLRTGRGRFPELPPRRRRSLRIAVALLRRRVAPGLLEGVPAASPPRRRPGEAARVGRGDVPRERRAGP